MVPRKVKKIYKICRHDQSKKMGIITPFVNQRKLNNESLRERTFRSLPEYLGCWIRPLWSGGPAR
jgi:hypothetical protein